MPPFSIKPRISDMEQEVNENNVPHITEIARINAKIFFI
jgi:hypothetical protein